MSAGPPLSERRFVTLMSVDIVGSTRLVTGMNPDDAQALLDSVCERIQRSVEARAGSIVSFTGDGALAVFGWPVPNERHADIACQASWEIQSKPILVGGLADPIAVRIGVASGLVAVRHVQFGLVSRYDVVGDPVHRAAALQKNAPSGAVLVCESTRGLSRLELAVEPRNLDLGLRSGPVRTFLLCEEPRESIGALLKAMHRYPLVGRDTEIEQIRRFLAHSGQSARVLVCAGEPGFGKSRLAAAAAQLATEQDTAVAFHECRELDLTTPFFGARALVQTLTGQRAGAIEPDCIAEAFDRAASAPEDRAATLSVFQTSQSALDRQASEPASQTRIARALAKIIGLGALSGPTLIIIDDFHNLDFESRQVLSFLGGAPTRYPLTLFLATRPEAQEFAAALAEQTIGLDALSDAYIGRLAAHVDERMKTPGARQRAIINRAAGNPFVLTQLVEGARWDAAQGDEDVLPGSVESLIHARLDRLSVRARSLVQALSLLGESVETDFAVAAAGPDARPDSDVMRELENLGFVQLTSNGVIRFRHALISSACASSVGRVRRLQIHNAAVETLSARTSELSNLYPRLAYHAVEGGRDDQAIEFYWLAARQARSLSAGQSLIKLFPKAIACCERLGTAGETSFIDLVLLVFETFHLQGEIHRIEPYLARATEMAEAAGRRDKVCVSRCHQGIAAWYHGRFGEGERIMRPALEEAKALGRLPLRFAAQFILAQQLHNQARIEEALELIEELCDLLVGDLEQARLGAMGLPASIAHSHAAYYSLEQARFADAETHLEKALSIAQRAADPYSESLARIALGRLQLLTGQNAGALECLKRGEELIERQGFDPALLNVSGLLATALSRLGRADEGVAQAEARLKQGLMSRTGSYERHYFNCGYGEALVTGGRREDGFAAIDAAIEIGRATFNNCILVQSLSLKAALLMAGAQDIATANDLIAEVKEIEARYRLRAPAHDFSPA
jgi:class 3 adenylate cyclase/tetratricopeptide (TPR) repeat protein